MKFMLTIHILQYGNLSSPHFWTSSRQRRAIKAYSLQGQKYPNRWNCTDTKEAQYYYVLNMLICVYSVTLSCKGIYKTRFLNDRNLHSEWISLNPSHISVCELLLTPQLHRAQHVGPPVYFLSDPSIDSSASWSTLTFPGKLSYCCTMGCWSIKSGKEW